MSLLSTGTFILVITFISNIINDVSGGTELLPNQAPSLSVMTTSNDDGKKCTSAGFFCASCSKLVNCIELSETEFDDTNFEVCDSKETCSEDLGRCTIEPNPNCFKTDYKFTCTQIGNFPHPFSCNQYYSCVKEAEKAEKAGPAITTTLVTCPTGYAYDPHTTLCNLQIKQHGCKLSVPPCLKGGQIGLINGSSNYYYTCNSEKLPKIYQCIGHLKFTGVKCEDPTKAVGEDGLCIGKGLYEDTNDCRSYLECLDKARPVLKRMCPPNSQFSFIDKKCIPYKCS